MERKKPELDKHGNLSKHDELLIRLTLKKEIEKPKPIKRPKIHIGINRKYIGMTQEERNKVKEG